MSANDVSHANSSDKSEQGKARFFRGFYSTCVVALIWTVVLVIIIAVKASIVSTVAATLASLAATFTAVIGIFKSDLKFPKIKSEITQGIVVAVLSVDFVLSAGWAGWSYYQANRAVDVLSTVTLSQTRNILPGEHATLDLAITAQRDIVVLVFRVVDHRPDLGSCLPGTSLVVTPDTAGNRGTAIKTSSGIPTVVDLTAGITKLHLDITVENTREDQNCGVDLSLESAKLQNK